MISPSLSLKFCLCLHPEDLAPNGLFCFLSPVCTSLTSSLSSFREAALPFYFLHFLHSCTCLSLRLYSHPEDLAPNNPFCFLSLIYISWTSSLSAFGEAALLLHFLNLSLPLRLFSHLSALLPSAARSRCCSHYIWVKYCSSANLPKRPTNRTAKARGSFQLIGGFRD